MNDERLELIIDSLQRRVGALEAALSVFLLQDSAQSENRARCIGIIRADLRRECGRVSASTEEQQL